MFAHISVSAGIDYCNSLLIGFSKPRLFTHVHLSTSRLSLLQVFVLYMHLYRCPSYCV